MNTFTKLIIGVLFLGITQCVFSQPMYVSQQKVDLPFHDGDAVCSFLNRQTSSDTIWLPAVVNEFANGIPSLRHIYEYHENGLLKKKTTYSVYSGEVAGTTDFNNIYSGSLMDILDTIFTNGHINPVTGEYQPSYRYYYNNRQADSSYWEEYYQGWDGDKWKPAQKTKYVHLLDTATVSGFQDHVETYGGYGGITYGHKAFLTFDEHGNVKEALIEVYDTYSKQYKLAAKNIYLYDDESKCHTWEQYVLISPDTWTLNTRFANMKWFEFHGFDNGDVLFFSYPTGLYDDDPKKNKNKLSYLEYWELVDDTLVLLVIDSVKWEIEPFSRHYDHYLSEGCIMWCMYQNFNEQGHITALGQLLYDEYWIVPCIPDPKLFSYILNDYINKYDDRGRRYEYIENQTWHHPPVDSIYSGTWTYTVDSFTYVGNVGIDEPLLEKHTLLIVPNPADETVRITATNSIAAINFYTSDGRLVYTQNGSGKEMIVNLRGLSKGIYIVQARLKDGGVQTGKMVKQ